MAKSIRIGTALTALGAIGLLSGCATPASKFADKSSVSGKPNAGLATRAIAALDKGDFANAISYAEQAVEHSPASAQFRALLGNAYFAGGRFASAEAAYRDSLAIQPDQAPVILKLALVTIGQGKNQEAIDLLQSAQAVLDPADHGLALALAGRPDTAALLLDAAARLTGADSRVRQNLALAHALAGDWTMARTVAEQDLAPDQVEARLQQWMSFAKPVRPSDQLAALTGISPAAADPGQPVRLALNPVAPRFAASEVAPSIASDPEPHVQQPIADVPVSEPVAVAAAAPPVIAEEAPPEITVPAVAIAAVVPAFVPPAPVVEAAASQTVEAAAAPAPMPRAAVAPAKPRQATLRPVKAGGAVVQLGAFTNRGNVESAWARYAAKHPSLRNYSPTTARFNTGDSTVYRLSVAGFASSREAQAYCASLKRAGAGCFVRSSGGDQPVRLALR